jgi:predicted GIY-YIG superfamily endonuclease
MQSVSRRVLYIGVTTDLHQRVCQHKSDLIDGFTNKYKCHRLVYFEKFLYIKAAIAREKQLKGWTRAKKEALIVRMNPHWDDLAADWKPRSTPDTPNGIKLQP